LNFVYFQAQLSHDEEFGEIVKNVAAANEKNNNRKINLRVTFQAFESQTEMFHSELSSTEIKHLLTR